MGGYKLISACYTVTHMLYYNGASTYADTLYSYVQLDSGFQEAVMPNAIARRLKLFQCNIPCPAIRKEKSTKDIYLPTTSPIRL